MNIETAADALLALINARPSSPTRDEIVGVLRSSSTNAVLRAQEGAAPATRVWNYTIHHAFDAFNQAIGPSMAYNERRNDDDEIVERCIYQTFAWKSRDLDKIVRRVIDLCSQLKSRSITSIVWRTAPELVKETDGTIYFYCRLHALPYIALPGAKPECEEMAEA